MRDKDDKIEREDISWLGGAVAAGFSEAFLCRYEGMFFPRAEKTLKV